MNRSILLATAACLALGACNDLPDNPESSFAAIGSGEALGTPIAQRQEATAPARAIPVRGCEPALIQQYAASLGVAPRPEPKRPEPAPVYDGAGPSRMAE
ncbi:MAG: hypothetical protein EP335_15725 [Alphaproteobacteria bacterium]|nr:MAG: hypothetical protein EP335_15725 [Alphaproteobacteria bacterium]